MITLVVGVGTAGAQSMLLDPRTATYGTPWKTVIGEISKNGKVLITFNALPKNAEVEILGPIYVYSRWFGTTNDSTKLLADKARSMGGNAVVETRVWLAPAFPSTVAPHGYGLAVRINDVELLNSLIDRASTWE